MLKKICLISSVLLCLSACDKFQANADNYTTASATNSPTVAPKPKRNLLEDREALSLAKTRLQAMPQFGGKPVQVFGNIDFFDGVRPRIELSVQSPDKADDIWILRYENEQWSPPTLDEDEEIDRNKIAPHLTPLSEIHFEDVVYAAQLWRTKAKEVNAVWTEPYHVAFIWMPKLKRRFWHTAEMDAVGAQYYLSLNLDGTIWEWKKL